MGGTLRLADAGWSTTIQDAGRPGHQRKGVPVSGALDRQSLALANRLVGNPSGAGALEAIYVGPTIVAETGTLRLAVVGANARLERLADPSAASGAPLPMNESFTLARGEAVKVGTLKGASVAYIAIEGGFDLPLVLGSMATDVRGGFGGWHARVLRTGDVLPLRLVEASVRRERRLPEANALEQGGIRIVLGPQADYFDDEEIERFAREIFTVSSETDRMGMRLNGVRLQHARGFNITSDAVTFGSIQVMGNGQPLVMLADRPTTGGYPKIATVITADLPRIGRMAAGTSVRFLPVTVEEAQRARLQSMREIEARIASIHEVGSLIQINLLEFNLISGFISASD